MSNKKTESPHKFVWAHNRPPLTRREFLAAGIISSAGFIFAPSMMKMLSDSLYADGFGPGTPCPAPEPGGSAYGHLTLDLAGGAGQTENFVALARNQADIGDKGKLLSSYAQLSVNANSEAQARTGGNRDPYNTDAIDISHGAPMWKGTSFLQAFTAAVLGANPTAADRAILNKVKFATISVRSQDDTRSNRFNPASLISKAIAKGKIIAGAAGDQAGSSGGNSDTAFVDANFTPLISTSVSTIPDALGFGGAIAAFPADKKVAMMVALNKMNDIQRANFQNRSLGDQFSFLTGCAYEKNTDFANGKAGVDYRLEPAANLNNVFGANSPFGQNWYAAAKGNAGGAVHTDGGHDYHGQGRTVIEAANDRAGTALGQSMRAAGLLGLPFVTTTISDGSVESTTTPDATGDRAAVADSGGRGLVVMAFFHPTTPTNIAIPQIGSYTDGQVADANGGELYFGASPVQAAYIVLANVLKFYGKSEAEIIAIINGIIGIGTFAGTESVAKLKRILALG